MPELKDLRLFSAGGGSELVEWDLEKGYVLVSFCVSIVFLFCFLSYAHDQLRPGPCPPVHKSTFVFRFTHDSVSSNHPFHFSFDYRGISMIHNYASFPRLCGSRHCTDYTFLPSFSSQRTLPSLGGAIWSLAVNPASTILALGCEDGCVRLVDVADGQLGHLRRMDRGRGRVLSVAWGPVSVSSTGSGSVAGALAKMGRSGNKADGDESDSDDDEEEFEYVDSYIVTGGTDSCLRKWDVRSGRVMQRMIVEKVRGERTLVWAVTCLRCVHRLSFRAFVSSVFLPFVLLRPSVFVISFRRAFHFIFRSFYFRILAFKSPFRDRMIY